MKDLSNIMLALDNFSKDELFFKLTETQNQLKTVKVGLELFCKYGPDLITEIYSKFECDIFLDLKLHDIPNTVKKSIASLEGLPIKFLTLHLSGGREMLIQAKEQAKLSLPNTKVLGVSYLTSLTPKDFKSIWDLNENDIENAFQRLFKLAIDTKIDGIVCSANELEIINDIEKGHCTNLIKVCPGIRFKDEIDSGNTHDQNRVLDPKNAFMNGADYLVMGRSLTQSTEIKERIEQLKEIMRSV